MSAEELVEKIINQALDTAREKADEAKDFADQAATAARGFSFFNAQLARFTPGNVEPPMNIPSAAAGVDTDLFNLTRAQIETFLVTRFSMFFAEYFPTDPAEEALGTLRTMLSGGSGIPGHIEEQIWQRDRARVLNEVGRSHREVLATFASRGFPLPPGAAQHQLSAMQQDAQDKIAQQSRDVAIKNLEVILENIRFAVQQALDFRIKGINAACDYLRILALGPDLAMKFATSAADAQAKLISAANTYYGSRIRLEELKFEVEKFNKSTQNTVGMHGVSEFGERLKAQVQVLAQAAQAAGTQAAAALNAVHASAQVAVQGETA